MDIKHHDAAVAARTLGKDMVFRDAAQGAFRMRGIARGQKVSVFIIPEVEDIVRRELAAAGRDERRARRHDRLGRGRVGGAVVLRLVVAAVLHDERFEHLVQFASVQVSGEILVEGGEER